MKSSWWKIIGLNGAALILFCLDRFFKHLFSQNGEDLILSSWFKLGLTYNPGIAFGLPFNYWLLLVIYAFVILVLVWFSVGGYQKKEYFLILALTLIIFGAFSNLLDRLYWQKIIDYFNLKYYSVFNLADVMIVAGAIGLGWIGWRRKKN